MKIEYLQTSTELWLDQLSKKQMIKFKKTLHELIQVYSILIKKVILINKINNLSMYNRDINDINDCVNTLIYDNDIYLNVAVRVA